jgi:hypothetical protein
MTKLSKVGSSESRLRKGSSVASPSTALQTNHLGSRHVAHIQKSFLTRRAEIPIMQARLAAFEACLNEIYGSLFTTSYPNG